MANKLATAKSPYLLQHAHHPVEWYPWGEEAFEKAKREDKPIFLSIGYSTCHWCHVMAHECFEDEEVAALLNRHFVSVKVDREERPDVDQVYMMFCQAFSSHCGWPLSIFMTPDRRPFFAGTYFPKHSRTNMVGLMELLPKIVELWAHARDDLERMSEGILALFSPSPVGQSLAERDKQSREIAIPAILHKAYHDLHRRFDHRWGGFGNAPKFPTPHQLWFLLRYYHRYGVEDARTMVEKTLTEMAEGGVYDQLGGGVHRYAVDREWLIPHFEKMLYDQALISLAYLEAFQVSGRVEYCSIVRETLDFVLREMTSPDGVFFSAQDADVEGEEGAYYLWRPEEIAAILGPEDGAKACAYWGVTPEGHLHNNRSVLCRHLDRQRRVGRGGEMSPAIPPDEIARYRKLLFEARARRQRPFTDDKIVTSLNGLMIAALARCGMVLGEHRYVAASEGAARWIIERMFQPENGKLSRRYRDHESLPYAFLEDYAYLSWGLLELFMATSDALTLDYATRITDTMIAQFWDPHDSSFTFSPKDGEQLPIEVKEFYDGATPSGNSVAFEVLTTIGKILGTDRYDTLAEEMYARNIEMVSHTPLAYTHLLCALDRFLGPTQEIRIVVGGDDMTEARHIQHLIARRFTPRIICFTDVSPSARSHSGSSPSGKTLVYSCEGNVCSPPVEGSVFITQYDVTSSPQ